MELNLLVRKLVISIHHKDTKDAWLRVGFYEMFMHIERSSKINALAFCLDIGTN